jgi:nitrite reductase/ring-hydroxylating ferredoxin subunit
MSDRRKFIKDSCTACVGLLAMTSMASLLSSCTSLTVYSTKVENGILTIPLTSFLPEEKMIIIRSKALTYDILLVRGEAGDHKAFLMKCSHQDNILVANNKGLTCNLHGSTFDLNGQATKGPATKPIQKLKTTEANDNILIYFS